MTDAQFKTYLTNLSTGITTIGSNVQFKNNTEVQNILGFLVYEINLTSNLIGSDSANAISQVTALINNTSDTTGTTTSQPSSNCDTFEKQEAFYLAQNPDIKAVVDKGDYKYGAEHWNRFGMKEGRKSCWTGTVTTTSQPSSNCDTFEKQEAYYLEKNPDIKAAVKSRDYKYGADHWNLHGLKEGRKSCWTEKVYDLGYTADGQIVDNDTPLAIDPSKPWLVPVRLKAFPFRSYLFES